MLYPDLIDVPFEVFGGYCPAVPPSDLSPGAAAIAQDVIFPQGAVRSRGGLKNFFSVASPIPANASINGLKSYITPALAQRFLAWDSLGNFYKESPQGTLSQIFSRPYTGLFYQSNTQFGREYQAFFNSLGGFDIPRQFDDTNWDRVSQSGPGASPQVGDENNSYALVASPGGLAQESTSTVAGPNGLVETGNVVTVTLSVAFFGLQAGDTVVIAGTGTAFDGTWSVSVVLSATQFQYVNPVSGIAASGGGTVSTSITLAITTAANNFVNGQMVKIAGAGVAGYNGTWTIRAVINTTNFYVVTATSGLAASGGGTVAAAGSISVGRHQLSVAFVTRQGLITMAAVPGFWNAAGGLRAVVAGIPIGPSNIVARLLMFTPAIVSPAITGNFFSLPNGSTQVFSSTMLINDNTATTATVDFTDTILQAGFSANYLFSQIELGECAFNAGYNSRGVWLGERNKVSNFVNMGFDGGFGILALVNVPLGWTPDPALSGGGSSAVGGGFTADWGDAYAITGDGVSATRGKITQSAYKDYLGVAIVQSATGYSIRARIARNNTLAAGTLHINLTSVSTGTTVGLAVTAAQLGTSYAEFSAVLTAKIAAPPADLVLQVYADGTPTNGGVFLIDSIEPYPTNNPFNYSLARFSHAFNPESFDATTGQVQIKTNDGQRLQAAFPLRNNLYFAKDHYLCYVTDDGINEPSSWGVNEVSATIGICGPNAVDWNEEWAVFAERSGVYICWGSDPVKITPEIQVDASGTGKVSWASINWAAAYTIWVRIDRANKMILVGVPTGAATTPNVVFMLDYKWLDTAQDIASSPLITYSSFTGKILSHGRGRRWSIWNITANSMTFAERSDGTAQPFFGNGTANGKIYQQLDCATQGSDDGVAIPWNYQGYGCPSQMEEQMFQLGAHRKLAGYMKFRAVGVGLLPLAISTTQRSSLLRSYTLSLVPTGDGERPINMSGERFFINIGSNAVVGSWFQLEKLVLCVKKNATIPVRGLSA